MTFSSASPGMHQRSAARDNTWGRRCEGYRSPPAAMQAPNSIHDRKSLRASPEGCSLQPSERPLRRDPLTLTQRWSSGPSPPISYSSILTSGPVAFLRLHALLDSAGLRGWPSTVSAQPLSGIAWISVAGWTNHKAATTVLQIHDEFRR